MTGKRGAKAWRVWAGAGAGPADGVGLTALETAIVIGVALGHSQQRMAQRLHYSESNVGMILVRLRRRVGVRTTAQLIYRLCRSGWLK